MPFSKGGCSRVQITGYEIVVKTCKSDTSGIEWKMADMFLFSFLYMTRPLHKSLRINVAEGVGFEPTDPFGSPVFKTGAINHSTIPPIQVSEPIRYDSCKTDFLSR